MPCLPRNIAAGLHPGLGVKMEVRVQQGGAGAEVLGSRECGCGSVLERGPLGQTGKERLGVTPHGPVFSPRVNLRPFLLQNWQCGVLLSGRAALGGALSWETLSRLSVLVLALLLPSCVALGKESDLSGFPPVK